MSWILFLDDDKLRHTAFRDNYPRREGDVIHHVFTYREAVEHLHAFDYDVMFLDHDLSLEDVMCNPDGPTNAKTGYDFVKYFGLSEQVYQKILARDTFVVVHSYNPVGAKRMVDQLNDYGIRNIYQPFAWRGKVIL
jgi:hypothetical protein